MIHFIWSVYFVNYFYILKSCFRCCELVRTMVPDSTWFVRPWGPDFTRVAHSEEMLWSWSWSCPSFVWLRTLCTCTYVGTICIIPSCRARLCLLSRLPNPYNQPWKRRYNINPICTIIDLHVEYTVSCVYACMCLHSYRSCAACRCYIVSMLYVGRYVEGGQPGREPPQKKKKGGKEGAEPFCCLLCCSIFFSFLYLPYLPPTLRAAVRLGPCPATTDRTQYVCVRYNCS